MLTDAGVELHIEAAELLDLWHRLFLGVGYPPRTRRLPTTQAMATTEGIAGTLDRLRMPILAAGWTAPFRVGAGLPDFGGSATDALDDCVHDCFRPTFKNLLHGFERGLGGCIDPQPYFRRCLEQLIELLKTYLALSVSDLSQGRSSSIVTLFDHRHRRTKDDEMPRPKSHPA